MTQGFRPLNVTEPGGQWQAIDVVTGAYGAMIAPAFPNAPEFDHWRVYRTEVVADPTITPVWSPSMDISGPLDPNTGPYPFVDTSPDQTGKSNYYWVVCFNADESLGGACLTSQILQGITPTQYGPFSYDGTMNPGVGNVFINGSAAPSPPWLGVHAPVVYLNSLVVAAQIAANAYGFTWAFIENTATFAANWPSPPDPGAAGFSVVDASSANNLGTSLSGNSNGFTSDELPVPVTNVSQFNAYGGTRLPGYVGVAPYDFWLEIDAAAPLFTIQAKGSAIVRLAWNAVLSAGESAGFPTPPGGYIGAPLPLAFPGASAPQPVPLPCIPCCNSCCAMPCKPGSYQL